MSVIIPTHNRAELVMHSIRSVYAQTVSPAEVIVVDDGSTDATQDALRALESELPASFRWVSQDNGGEASARNRGLDLARHALVAFLDSDDTWHPCKLEYQLARFAQDPALVLSFTAYHRSDGARSDLVLLPQWDPDPIAILRELMIGCCITNSTVMIRRSAFSQLPPFDETMPLSCDWPMWLNVAASGMKIDYLAAPLMTYRWHDQNMSRDASSVADVALSIFPRFFARSDLPEKAYGLERWCYARWHMIKAFHCLAAGSHQMARRHILSAARAHPASIRPGWVWLLIQTGVGYLRGRRAVRRDMLPPERS